MIYGEKEGLVIFRSEKFFNFFFDGGLFFERFVIGSLVYEGSVGYNVMC